MGEVGAVTVFVLEVLDYKSVMLIYFMKFFHNFFKISWTLLYHFFQVLQNFAKLFQNFIISAAMYPENWSSVSLNLQQCYPTVLPEILKMIAVVFLRFPRYFSLIFSKISQNISNIFSEFI